MKIEKLNEDKIKITLSVEDLKERNIDVYSFMYNTPESQDLFWDMIHEAELQHGFCVDESMVYVEAAASGNDIFTLIVTKTNATISSPILKHKLKKGSFKLKRKPISLELKTNLYSFESFDDLCSFCEIIDVTKISNNSLYKLDDIYYLRTDIMPYNSILEYATIVKSPELLLARINEYGEIITEDNALQTIRKHFFKKSRRKK